MKKEYDETIKWLKESLEIPVEEMADFFKARVDDYEEVHNRHWPGIYRTMPGYFPEHFETLLDIGCGSGLECDVIFKKYPDIKFLVLISVEQCLTNYIEGIMIRISS